jgi:hypothetical protein
LYVRVCQPDGIVHGGTIAARLRQQFHFSVLKVSGNGQGAIGRPLNLFPPAIERALDRYQSSNSPLRLSFQKRIPFFWPRFGWLGVAELGIARHADLNAIGIDDQPTGALTTL